MFLLIFVLYNISYVVCQLQMLGVEPRWMYDFYTLRSPGVNSTNLSPECLRQTEEYALALEHNVLEAIKMLDASSKLPSGFLYNRNAVDWGNFDECLAVDYKSFQGKYCMTRLNLAHPVFYEMVKASMDNISEITMNDFPIGLRWAICIPSGCTAQDLNNQLNDYFRLPFMNASYGQLVYADEEQCYTLQSEQEKNSLSWISITMLSLIAAVIASSTIFDIYCSNKDTQKYKLLSAFSWYSNAKKLLSMKSTERGQHLYCLDGIRVCSLFLVMGAHLTDVTNTHGSKIANFKDERNAYWDPVFLGMNVLITFAVDTFMLVSGCVLMYTFLIVFKEKKRSFNLLEFYLHRYIRLTPTYLALVIIMCTLYPSLVGSGPFAGEATEWSKDCRDGWWLEITYLQNYIDPDTMCLVHAWYLCVDMQYYIISPIILLLVLKRPKHVGHIFTALLLIATAIPVILAWQNDYHFSIKKADTFNELKEFVQNYYAVAHTRAAPWVLGLLFGYIIFNHKKHRSSISRGLATIYWILSLVIFLLIVYTVILFHEQNFMDTKILNVLYIGVHRTLWALFVGWVIYASEFKLGIGNMTYSFLSMGIFQVGSRLSFTVYLTHYIIIIMGLATMRTPVYYDYFNTWYRFSSLLITSFVVSFLLDITIQMPFSTITVALLKGRTKKQILNQKNDEIVTKC